MLQPFPSTFVAGVSGDHTLDPGSAGTIRPSGRGFHGDRWVSEAAIQRFLGLPVQGSSHDR